MLKNSRQPFAVDTLLVY